MEGQSIPVDYDLVINDFDIERMACKRIYPVFH